MTEQEFEIQTALGLACECIFDINVAVGNRVDTQEIIDAVEKHTFSAICLEKSSYYYPVKGRNCADKLKFDIKCIKEVSKVIRAIAREMYPHILEIKVTFKRGDICRMLLPTRYVYIS
ncbi:hypothetical protein LCGC14_2021640 [marine sediment metagenome]|uniref:Uncharacterized protein n=1 Tax=marine sediment metagenome TaxID=412755 RepID=A0A0F9HAQ5_9ZZZZ